MKLVFDIGMYDGADSRYYLDLGFRVVAVEANPDLAASAREKFSNELESGQLILVEAAIAEYRGEIELSHCAEDSGASTVFAQRIEHRGNERRSRVRAMPFSDLLEQYGTPYFLKIDIEGADRLCVLSLDKTHRPDFLSFEVDGNPEELEELLAHAERIGFTKFKLIGQCSFLELSNERSLKTRVVNKIVRTLGFDEPQRVRRAGRWFKLMHSSGPVPWLSDGAWCSAESLATRFHQAQHRGLTMGWYDVQTC